MILLVPCCGESQRYNGVKKQFLTLPNGLPLPVFSASGIANSDRTIYTFIREDYEKHIPGKLVYQQGLCLLDERTTSQVETIRRTIINEELYEQKIYIKDCDNYFEAVAAPNTVTVKSIRNAAFKLNNKSYTAFDGDGELIRIAERSQISQYINVGGYGFASGEMFLRHSEGKKFVSQVITAARQYEEFHVNFCKQYIDYGEQDDYDKFIKQYDTTHG